MWQTGTNIFAECTASIFTLCSTNIFVPPYQTTACCHNTEGYDVYQISYQYTATPLLPAVNKQRVIPRCRQDMEMCVSRTYTKDCAAVVTMLAIISRSAITHHHILPYIPTSGNRRVNRYCLGIGDECPTRTGLTVTFSLRDDGINVEEM
jgi:hypothetical protein